MNSDWNSNTNNNRIESIDDGKYRRVPPIPNFNKYVDKKNDVDRNKDLRLSLDKKNDVRLSLDKNGV